MSVCGLELRSSVYCLAALTTGPWRKIFLNDNLKIIYFGLTRPFTNFKEISKYLTKKYARMKQISSLHVARATVSRLVDFCFTQAVKKASFVLLNI